MSAAQIIERIYDHLENDEVEKAVMACLRLARLISDKLNTGMFLHELYPDREEFVRVLYDDFQELKPEAFKLAYETSFKRWMEAHKTDVPMGRNERGEEKNMISRSIAEIEQEIETLKQEIGELVVPPGMGEFDTAAFTDQMASARSQRRLYLSAHRNVRNKIKARCLSYATQIEKQLAAQRVNQNAIFGLQSRVNNYFRSHAPEVYEKLIKATNLLNSNDNEDAALLLTSIRRAVSGAADHFYPPKTEMVLCSDGIERKLGPDQYLNRLTEFVSVIAPKGASKDLIKAELEVISAFSRRLNDLASKGVHASVTHDEAEQGLIGLYFFLANLIRFQERSDKAGSVADVSDE